MLLDHGGASDREMSTVEEGSEPEAFWDALGGIAEYPEASEVEAVTQEPRLFQVMNDYSSRATGSGVAPRGMLGFGFTF